MDTEDYDREVERLLTLYSCEKHLPRERLDTRTGKVIWECATCGVGLKKPEAGKCQTPHSKT